MLSEKLLLGILNKVFPERDKQDNKLLARAITIEYFKAIREDKQAPSIVKLSAALKILANYLEVEENVLFLEYIDGSFVAKMDNFDAVNLSTSNSLMDVLILLAAEVVKK